MADEEATEGEAAKKKSSPMVLIGAVVVLTLLAAGGGWFIGGMVAPKPMTKEMADAIEAVKKAEAEKKAALAAGAPADAHGGGEKKDEGLPKLSTAAHGILQLDPITTNLAYPTENWIRLELALAFNGEPDPKIAEAIQQDIAAYLRTVSLQQIQGPRGFQYLRDDIEERVDLRSEGRVTNVIFRTFVIQ
ncbi:flagellar basal body-associated FliL family protein [Rhizobium sp. SG2393]|uniref:flagellar basal body-associated FliL family protein n=1 Tax=Rhizobium sp. SG2393 TaxID=3276279 RepID=UPI00366CAB79